MVIFHHGGAMEDKGIKVRGGAIHQGISHGRRSFTTKRVPWIRCLERTLQWRKRKRERERKREGEHEIEGGKEGEKLNFEVCFTRVSFIKVTTSVTHASIYRLGDAILPPKGIGQKTPRRLGQKCKRRPQSSHEPQGRFRAHGLSMNPLILVHIRLRFFLRLGLVLWPFQQYRVLALYFGAF